MNNEILNNIFNKLDEISKQKKSPIIDIIDRPKYKIYIVTNTFFVCENGDFLKEHLFNNLTESGKEFFRYYRQEDYTTHNNKRRWSYIIFKDNINNLVDKKYNIDLFEKTLISKVILKNRITKYDRKGKEDFIDYIMNNF